MHYQQAAIAVSARQAEPLSDALMEHGALSTAIEDAHAGTAADQNVHRVISTVRSDVLRRETSKQRAKR